MRWLIIPWVLTLGFFVLFYAALGSALDALIASALPFAMSARISFLVMDTYPAKIEDSAQAPEPPELWEQQPEPPGLANLNRPPERR